MGRRTGSSHVSPGRRTPRLLVRRGDRALLYRAPAWTVVLLAALVAVLATGAVIAGLLLAGAAAVGVAILAWLALALRVIRLAPAGPRGDGPAAPGGAGVREPRHPLPHAPAGAAAAPIPQENAARAAILT